MTRIATSVLRKVTFFAALLATGLVPGRDAHASPPCATPAPATFPMPPGWPPRAIPWPLPWLPPPAALPPNVPLPLPWLTPSPAPAPAPASAWPEAWARFEEETLARTNAYRAQGATCGDRTFGPAGPLLMSAPLRDAARAHSRDMGIRGYFAHESQDGRSPNDRMLAAGWQGKQSGENIFGGPRTAAEVVDGWMKSPGHCQNIMTAGYKVLGVGYAEVPGSPLTHYWTQDFGG